MRAGMGPPRMPNPHGSRVRTHMLRDDGGAPRGHIELALAPPLFFALGRQVGQVGPDRPREPVACHSRDCIDERSPRTGAGVRTLPKSLLPRGGLNALFLAAPLPLLKLSPTPRRRRWGASHPRPRCTARQHVDRHESCSKNAAREATRPPFSPFSTFHRAL